MAVGLGKRKRKTGDRIDEVEDRSDVEPQSSDDTRALFQRAFEAKFKPLPSIRIAPTEKEVLEQEDGRSDAGSDFSGFSDDEGHVETVYHAVVESTVDTEERVEKRAFMSSRPPVLLSKMAKSPSTSRPDPEDSADEGVEAANLKNDLALQRLLKEAHIMETEAAQLGSGKSRLKALDLRLKDLGATTSHLAQGKTPMSHRKGMQAKSAQREVRRRRDAAENGVVLEKIRAIGKPKERRERSIGGPTVGKFKGGTLKLSSKDVRSIERARGKKTGRPRVR